MRLHTFVLILICLAMGACGVKPGDVSPPKDAQNSAFPRTYPDVSTDPEPES